MNTMMRGCLCVLLLVFLIKVNAFGQTQAEMNEAACKEAKRVDAELNAIYTGVLKKQSDDQDFVEKLKAAQRAWIAFRDAEMAAHYPAKDKSEYGSVFNLCYCNDMTKLTRQRIQELKHWLDDREEGDVCP